MTNNGTLTYTGENKIFRYENGQFTIAQFNACFEALKTENTAA